MSNNADIEKVKISSWAAPTAEDIAILDALTDEQYRALLAREIERGFASGTVETGLDQVWQEALRRMKAKAPTPDAL